MTAMVTSTENQHGMEKRLLSNTEHVDNDILLISPKIIKVGILPTPSTPLHSIWGEKHFFIYSRKFIANFKGSHQTNCFKLSPVTATDVIGKILWDSSPPLSSC